MKYHLTYLVVGLLQEWMIWLVLEEGVEAVPLKHLAKVKMSTLVYASCHILPSLWQQVVGGLEACHHLVVLVPAVSDMPQIPQSIIKMQRCHSYRL